MTVPSKEHPYTTGEPHLCSSELRSFPLPRAHFNGSAHLRDDTYQSELFKATGCKTTHFTATHSEETEV